MGQSNHTTAPYGTISYLLINLAIYGGSWSRDKSRASPIVTSTRVSGVTTRLGTPDTEARGITKSTTHVPPTAVSWQEYEEADVSLLSRLTKDDSDAALAVRLCTEGKTTAMRDHYWLFKDN